MPRVKYLVSRTYDVVTEESAEEGDYAETGFRFEDTLMDREDTVRELENCCHLSSSVRSPKDLNGREWASTESDTDFSTGDNTTESVHVKRADGTPLTGLQLWGLFRDAGLIKRKRN